MSTQKAILIGISGPSSSGKTTLSRHLRDIFNSSSSSSSNISSDHNDKHDDAQSENPRCFILHEDDFYLPDAQIPTHDGLADWDCLESLNLPDLHSALQHIRSQGSLPPDLFSKEDKNSVGPGTVPSSLIENLSSRARSILTEPKGTGRGNTSSGSGSRTASGSGSESGNGSTQSPRIAIIDGFLLFSEEMSSIRDLFDVKLFLKTDYATAKRRREARTGYVTLEGFWEDPPGYVDRIVWPNYVKDHSFLFVDGNVEGEFDTEVCGGLGINVMPAGAQRDMAGCVEWAYGVVEESILEKR